MATLPAVLQHVIGNAVVVILCVASNKNAHLAIMGLAFCQPVSLTIIWHGSLDSQNDEQGQSCRLYVRFQYPDAEHR